MNTRVLPLFLAVISIATCSCQKYDATNARGKTPIASLNGDVISTDKKLSNLSGVTKVSVPNSLIASKVKRSDSSGSVVYTLSVDDVIALDGTIVIGKPIQSFLGRSHYVRYHTRDTFDNDPSDYPEEEYTVGNFQVTQVLHQGPGVSLEPGQIIDLSEPVGLLDYGSEGFIKSVIENCTEIKQNATYVMFVEQYTDGTYNTTNFNLGRFNTDGTDPEDEIGGPVDASRSKTDKQKLREELTARYGVQFNFLPQVRIGRTQDDTVYPPCFPNPPVPAPCDPKPVTNVYFTTTAPLEAIFDVIVEAQSGDGTWTVAGNSSFISSTTNGMVTIDRVPDGTELRIRATKNGKTSNYSQPYTKTAIPTLPP